MGRQIAPGAGSVLSLAFSRDGTLLATGSYAGRLDLWDVATQARHGKPMRVADDGVPSVAFDPSGRLVAAGGATGPVRVWRVADQRPAFPPLAGHTGPVTGAAFDPAGSFLATTSLFGGTRLWDPATGLGYGDELVGERRARLARRRPSTFRSSGCGTRSARTASCWPSRGSRRSAMLWDVDPAVWRRRACAIVGPKPEPRGVEALPAVGDAVSRDVLGVAHRLNRAVAATLAERSETVPSAQPTSACRGIVPAPEPPSLAVGQLKEAFDAASPVQRSTAKHWLMPVLVASVIAAAWAWSASAITGPQTLSLIEVSIPNNDRPLGDFRFDRPPAAGDRFVGTNALYKEGKRGRSRQGVPHVRHRIRARLHPQGDRAVRRSGVLAGRDDARRGVRAGQCRRPFEVVVPFIGGTGLFMRTCAVHVNVRNLTENKTQLEFHLLP